jgi:small conductance mechanosensitive channel
VDATADKELAEIVDQERAELARGDLLNVNAGEE